ncbi:MAG TPA: LacI family DNA-binding transcriptional regulator [Kofleriaceae bacterium]|nr:LacI family DNA-binding transcriptional regulator [Kofleriaceae bacterium]
MTNRRPPARPPAPTTINDVAREARVSVASVSRVVNGHANVLPETRQRILEVIDRLRYVPHTAARSLITRRSQMIGVLLPDLHGEFFSELIRGIDGAAREHGLHVLLSSLHGDAAEMAAAVRAMHGRVEGLLVLAPQLDTTALRELPPAVPAVFMNSRVAGRTSSLAIDSYGGARTMVRHLIACGHRTIAHITGPISNFDAHERERGYRDELAASQPAARPRIVRGDFTETSGYEAGRALAAAAARPDAVFAGNDAMAIGCLAALDALGVAVPDDVAVAGFDGIPLGGFVRPTLTTMRVPIVELGGGAVHQLAGLIAQPDTKPAAVTLQPELVVRDSCGANRPQRPRAPSSSRPSRRQRSR